MQPFELLSEALESLAVFFLCFPEAQPAQDILHFSFPSFLFSFKILFFFPQTKPISLQTKKNAIKVIEYLMQDLSGHIHCILVLCLGL